MEVLSVFIEKFLVAMATLIAPMAAVWLFAEARRAWAEFRLMQPKAAELLEQIAPIAVRAAEQAHLGGLIQDKKTYALEYVEKWLAAQGMTIDLDLISAAIEAAVWEEFNKKRIEPQVAPAAG